MSNKKKEINFFEETYNVIRKELDNLKQKTESIKTEDELTLFKGTSNTIKYSIDNLFNLIKTPEESEKFAKIKAEYETFVAKKIKEAQIE